MARYIDADKLIEDLKEERDFKSDMLSDLTNEAISAGISIAIKMVKKTPTADVEEVKHGYWKHSVEFGFVAKYHFWNCSLCGVASEDEGNEKYCRECGAKNVNIVMLVLLLNQ